jgi:mono/diheme cytochrome c family protein/protein-disulfide isomerase
MSMQITSRFTRVLINCGLVAGLLLVLPAKAEERWYDQADVDKGAAIYQQNCASCHGENAEATANWQDADASGNYPPPPLNGTAHAWHHSLDMLKKAILDGGSDIGGVMPGFKDRLSASEIDAVLAYVQSKWPDEVYAKWAARYEVGNIVASADEAAAPGQASAQKSDQITDLLKLRLGSDKVSEPVNTPVVGIFQTQFGKNYAYLTSNGRYLFMADLIDLQQEQNLTNNARQNIATPPPKPLSPEITALSINQDKTDLLKLRLGSNAISEPIETPVTGIYQAQFGMNFAYLTADGRYALMGDLIDLELGQNFSDIGRRSIVRTELNRFATENKAIFPATGEEKAVIDIFTDTSCFSCRKLFLELPQLQAAGISVQYLPYADGGLGSPGYNTLRQVWCSEDKAKALTIGKGLLEGTLPAGNCADGDLVDIGQDLGSRVGVVGTPAIFKQNGAQIKGYVSYDKLIPMILNN